MVDQMKTHDERYQMHIDILRILCAFLVIINHTITVVFRRINPSATWFISLTEFYISKVAVPVFLMISGALLLGKQDSFRRIAKRILRIVVITAVGSLVYFSLDNSSGLTMGAVSEYLRCLWSGEIIVTYWYLYLYMGVLLMLPLLQKMTAVFSKNDIRYLLMLSLGVCGLYPLLNSLFGKTPSEDLIASFFSPFVGMIFAGYYVERHMMITRRKCLISFAVFVLLVAFEIGFTYVKYIHYPNDPSEYLAMDNVRLLPITASAICFYVIIKYLFGEKKLSLRVRKTIRTIGSWTFGVYLVADLFVRYGRDAYKAMQLTMHPLAAHMIWAVGCFAASCGVVALLKRIPHVGKWL